jgi:Papain-like cysteine protease AvrRpt2
MFTKDLSANVPLYGQEQCIWCGAASGQMARNGYPNPADRLFYAQVDVWNTIQVNNSTAPADSGWATDPHGLTGCLQSLSNPPGVHWVEFANSSRDAVLFDILYWMDQRSYPCPVLINQGGHWVVIVGYVTDVEPLAGSSPLLQTIYVHDPEPHNVGTNSTFSAAQWFGGPWNGAVIYTGTWLNQYVAVIEPPMPKGRVRVRRVKRTGRKLLSPQQASVYARRWVEELGLSRQDKYSLLTHKDVTAGKPLLVREGVGRSERKNSPHYYIVPYGFRRELAEEGSRLTRACVLVNAYTGAFEEITTFGKPIRYLSQEEALAIVAAALRRDSADLKRAEATLTFQPGDITHIRSYPFWCVTLGKRTVYVDQLGKLYGKFLPSVPGD